MSFDLGVLLRVITSPTSAFEEIRNNDGKYFAQSIVLLALTSILSALVILPFVMIPISDEYFGDDIDNSDLPTENIHLMLSIVVGFLKGIVTFVSVYFIGMKLGGNKDWKKVFTVIFHTYVPAIPMMMLISVFVFLMWISLAQINPTYFMSEDMDEKQIIDVFAPLAVYGALVGVSAIAFIVWIIVISVKAIKIVNGFETGKAFGLLIVVMIIASIVSMVFNA